MCGGKKRRLLKDKTIRTRIGRTLTIKILHVETSSIYFFVTASRNRTSENPLALASVSALQTYRISTLLHKRHDLDHMQAGLTTQKAPGFLK